MSPASSFEDHFSAQAADYARYRPHYPPQLFEYLASVAPGRSLAWDCGTGNGQAAIALGEHFERVVATDASAEQIAHARPHPRVTYRVAPAERSGLEDRWADLVTVGQAVHWFGLKSFFEEVRRVGAAGSVLAVWAYDLFRVDASVDRVFRDFHESVERYWPPERKLVARRYADLPFPFEEIPVPAVQMTAAWDLERTLGYLSTWSSVKRCTKETGRDPLAEFAERFAGAWERPREEKTVTWPLVLRAGRIG